MSKGRRDKAVVDQRRRAALRALGAGALATAIAPSIVVGAAGAQPVGTTVKPALRLDPSVLRQIRLQKLSSLDGDKLNAIRLAQRLPADVNIGKLGLTPEGVKRLTPAAQGLTKADLETLGTGLISNNAKLAALTVDDVASIRDAFGKFYQPGRAFGGRLASIDVSCCCCTPCCCAAAVDQPINLAA